MRAFAVNESGLTYSDTTSYYLDIELPQIVTLKAGETVNADLYSASIKGSIAELGSEPVLAYGHCWSTAKNPTVEDDNTQFTQTENPGDFVSNITGLMLNTSFYVRAYYKQAAIYFTGTGRLHSLNDEELFVRWYEMYITTCRPKATMEDGVPGLTDPTELPTKPVINPKVLLQPSLSTAAAAIC
jgi:hypothetical protein